MDPAFADSRDVILPPDSPVLPAPTSPTPHGSVRLQRPRLDSLVAEIETSDPAWLVVLEAAHPGWTARIDGTPVPISTANFLFRAVPVPAGTHRVEMQYRAPGLRLGLALSAAALVFGAIVATRHRRHDL
jgi:hypothetical protein